MISILFIDDERTIREGMCTILRRKGYHVDGAEDGSEGISLYDSGSYDIVVTDMVMPNMNGYQVIKTILDMQGETKFIIITGALTPHIELLIERSKKLVDMCVITKPFTPEELNLNIKNKIGTKKQKII